MAIVLNGTSSAGKSSIARALQRISPQPMLHISLDTFTDMFRWDAITDVETRREGHRTGLGNFFRALPGLTGGKYPAVVDVVFERPEWHTRCQEALAGRPVLWVGVRCPLDVVQAREQARGDRRIGLAALQFAHVHEAKVYGLEVDTSQASPETCAQQILTAAAQITTP